MVLDCPDRGRLASWRTVGIAVYVSVARLVRPEAQRTTRPCRLVLWSLLVAVDWLRRVRTYAVQISPRQYPHQLRRTPPLAQHPRLRGDPAFLACMACDLCDPVFTQADGQVSVVKEGEYGEQLPEYWWLPPSFLVSVCRIRSTNVYLC